MREVVYPSQPLRSHLYPQPDPWFRLRKRKEKVIRFYVE